MGKFFCLFSLGILLTMTYRQVRFSEIHSDDEAESEEEFDAHGRMHDPIARMKAQREARKKNGGKFYLSISTLLY